MSLNLPDRVGIETLKLTDFRNYGHLTLQFGSGPVVLTGENGAGKTNLLEAVSLLTPGKGLRRANAAEIVRLGATSGYGIHATLGNPLGKIEIGTGTVGGAAREGENSRRVRINRTSARTDDLLCHLRVMWLTPAMDGLFSGPGGDRRRFVDRLVLAIDPAHAKRAISYEKAMRGRNRLLGEGQRNDAWFDAIETQMSESGVAIAIARNELVHFLNRMMDSLPEDGPFPKAGMELSGFLRSGTGPRSAIELEEEFRKTLAASRSQDRGAGRTLVGPHRSDLVVHHMAKNMPAAQCSTGEQKALLTGLVLAHARLVGRISGMAPILLLDEIAAHLDARRRAALYSILETLNCQAFMTGTDRSLFGDITKNAQFITITQGAAVGQS